MKKNILFLMACLLALPAFAQETSVEQAAAQAAEQAVAQAEQEDPAERNKMRNIDMMLCSIAVDTA